MWTLIKSAYPAEPYKLGQFIRPSKVIPPHLSILLNSRVFLKTWIKLTIWLLWVFKFVEIYIYILGIENNNHEGTYDFSRVIQEKEFKEEDFAEEIEKGKL